jgi:excisionase family DNA binding protein
MRGLGAFQLAQMKHRDRRVIELCQHLRSAIDIFEEIASRPAPHAETKPEPPPPIAPAPVIQLPPEKLAYTLKEASLALGIGKTTLYKAIAEGHLSAIKLGNRTLIPADVLRAWIAAMPPRQGRPYRKP